MTNIFYSPEFRKEIRRLAKKYRSIPEDLIELRTRLLDNPFEGVDLGMGVRKVRMSIKSKGKGKPMPKGKSKPKGKKPFPPKNCK